MKPWRAAALAWALALPAMAAAPDDAPRAQDPLKTPACLAARERLDAIMAEPKPDLVLLRAARTRAARACFREEAEAVERAPARLDRPRLPTPLVSVPPPIAPTAPPPAPPPSPSATAAPPPVAPAQLQRCDAGGCWDSTGQRLNQAGNVLLDGWGRRCTTQGTVLNCQ